MQDYTGDADLKNQKDGMREKKDKKVIKSILKKMPAQEAPKVSEASPSPRRLEKKGVRFHNQTEVRTSVETPLNDEDVVIQTTLEYFDVAEREKEIEQPRMDLQRSFAQSLGELYDSAVDTQEVLQSWSTSLEDTLKQPISQEQKIRLLTRIEKAKSYLSEMTPLLEGTKEKHTELLRQISSITDHNEDALADKCCDALYELMEVSDEIQQLLSKQEDQQRLLKEAKLKARAQEEFTQLMNAVSSLHEPRSKCSRLSKIGSSLLPNEQQTKPRTKQHQDLGFPEGMRPLECARTLIAHEVINISTLLQRQWTKYLAMNRKTQGADEKKAANLHKALLLAGPVNNLRRTLERLAQQAANPNPLESKMELGCSPNKFIPLFGLTFDGIGGRSTAFPAFLKQFDAPTHQAGQELYCILALIKKTLKTAQKVRTDDGAIAFFNPNDSKQSPELEESTTIKHIQILLQRESLLQAITALSETAITVLKQETKSRSNFCSSEEKAPLEQKIPHSHAFYRPKGEPSFTPDSFTKPTMLRDLLTSSAKDFLRLQVADSDNVEDTGTLPVRSKVGSFGFDATSLIWSCELHNLMSDQPDAKGKPVPLPLSALIKKGLVDEVATALFFVSLAKKVLEKSREKSLVLSDDKRNQLKQAIAQAEQAIAPFRTLSNTSHEAMLFQSRNEHTQESEKNSEFLYDF